MSSQQRRTLQTTVTSLSGAEVLAAAKRHFSSCQGIYAAFLEKEGPTFVSLRGQGTEEIVIGVATTDAGTAVTGSSYLFDQQIARFLATLPPYPTEDTARGPVYAGESVDEPMTADEAPPGGVQPSGLATPGGVAAAAGTSGGSPA